MILEILRYPDARLREKSLPVTEFGPELQRLAGDMIETMYAARGIGLAAAQVNVLKQMLVIDCRSKDEKGHYTTDDMTDSEAKINQPLVIINPKITSKDGKQIYEEGCLSVPSFFDNVERANQIVLEYQNLKGDKIILETDGTLAVVIQHEMDHLDGTLFIDRLSYIKSNKIKNQIKKHGYPEKEEDPEEQKNLEKVLSRT